MVVKTQCNKKVNFNSNDILNQYRQLPPEQIVASFQRVLEAAIINSEDAVTGYFGTVKLADGREARVKINIDAEYVIREENNYE